jgi:hypothetical protein
MASRDYDGNRIPVDVTSSRPASLCSLFVSPGWSVAFRRIRVWWPDIGDDGPTIIAPLIAG